MNYMFFHELRFLYIFSHQAPHLLFQAHSPCYSWNQGGGGKGGLCSKNSHFPEYTTYLQALLTYFFQVSFKMWSTQRDPPGWPYISYTILTIRFILLPCLASVLSLNHIQLSATWWTRVHQAPLSMEFSR